MSEHSAASITAWSRYWNSAQLAACLGGEDGNYAGAIRSIWESYFAQSAAGATVVDLATGNGAIALIAAAVSRERGLNLDVHGIDRAELAPERAAGPQAELLGTIRFHAHTTVESMPFENESVALISSQYGIEYADRGPALRECARILEPGGRLMAVVHCDDSKVMQQTKVDLRDSRLLIRELDLVDRFKSLLNAELGGGLSADSPDRFARLKADFQQASAAVIQAIRGRDEKQARFLNEVMHRFGEIYQQRREKGLDDCLALADEIFEELTAHQRRLLDLEEAALSAQDVERWNKEARGFGFDCRVERPVFNGQGGKVGFQFEWVLAAT